MTRAILTQIGGGLLVLATLVGCGKSDNQTPRFNEVLGGSYGAPTGTASVDMGLTQDGANYKPANVPGMPAAAVEAGGAAAGGPEVEAIRGVIRDSLGSLFKLNVPILLDNFAPDQVAELTKEGETKSALINTADTFDSFVKVLRDKSATLATAANPETIAKQIDGFAQAVKIQVVSADNATISLDPAALQQMAAGAPAGGAPGGAPGMDPSAMLAQLNAMNPGGASGLPLKKVGGSWKFVLPHTINEKEAELVREAAGFARNYMLKVQEKLDAVTDKLDDAALQNLLMTSFLEMGPELVALQEKARGVMPAADSAPASEQPKTDQPPQPQTPNPRGRRTVP